MAYPQQAKIHGMIELLHRELNKAYEQGESELRIVYSSGGEPGIYPGGNTAPQNNAANRLGVSGGEAVGLFKYVCREGYVRLSYGSDLSKTVDFVTVEYIAPRGLLEIGELPNPHERFLMGLEAAIQAIREDDRMSPETKKKGIDWLEEGKQLGRPLAVDVIKAMFRGELPIL
jgi:hypothetical protein